MSCRREIGIVSGVLGKQRSHLGFMVPNLQTSIPFLPNFFRHSGTSSLLLCLSQNDLYFSLSYVEAWRVKLLSWLGSFVRLNGAKTCYHSSCFSCAFDYMTISVNLPFFFFYYLQSAYALLFGGDSHRSKAEERNSISRKMWLKKTPQKLTGEFKDLELVWT